ncbi:hypothetical protein DWU99_01140 [Dyella psychrodurans]|uniref:Uncharacterized protein n=1 Tax=Dyella psychrodurans TaxID=1927960 RepID=A0A370XC79_9GAMM|nr:hypothetical protein DWU99_01140 [Dyella psychrodurans]
MVHGARVPPVSRRPLWWGLVATPWLVPVAFFPLALAYYALTGQHATASGWGGFLGFAYLFGVPLGYVALAVLGWPWVSVLQRWNKLVTPYVCAGACVIGAVAFEVFAALVGTAQRNTTEVLGIGLVTGLLAGLIFCAVAGVPFRSHR